MQRLLAVSLVCAASTFYAMENRLATKISNLSTHISTGETHQDIYSLLRYPSDDFAKTDIIVIDGPVPEAESFKRRVFQVQKQGTLSSLTSVNIADIANGYACYHYNIRKSQVNSNLDIGAIAIDKQAHSSTKYDHDLQDERNAILTAALQRKIERREKNLKELKERLAL